eukprot:SAG22_NODE_114_length_19318_cov_13.809980_11_plen_707_part_00
MLGLRKRKEQRKAAATDATGGSGRDSTRLRHGGAAGGGEAGASAAIVHTGFSCRGCGVLPIIGPRYRSLKATHQRFGCTTSFCGACMAGALGPDRERNFGPFKLEPVAVDSGLRFEELGLETQITGNELFTWLQTGHKLQHSLLWRVLAPLDARQLCRLQRTCQLFNVRTAQLNDGLALPAAVARLKVFRLTAGHPAAPITGTGMVPAGRRTRNGLPAPRPAIWPALLASSMLAGNAEPRLVIHPPRCTCVRCERHRSGQPPAAAAAADGDATGAEQRRRAEYYADPGDWQPGWATARWPPKDRGGGAAAAAAAAAADSAPAAAAAAAAAAIEAAWRAARALPPPPPSLGGGGAGDLSTRSLVRLAFKPDELLLEKGAARWRCAHGRLFDAAGQSYYYEHASAVQQQLLLWDLQTQTARQELERITAARQGSTLDEHSGGSFPLEEVTWQRDTLFPSLDELESEEEEAGNDTEDDVDLDAGHFATGGHTYPVPVPVVVADRETKWVQIYLHNNSRPGRAKPAASLVCRKEVAAEGSGSSSSSRSGSGQWTVQCRQDWRATGPADIGGLTVAAAPGEPEGRGPTGGGGGGGSGGGDGGGGSGAQPWLTLQMAAHSRQPAGAAAAGGKGKGKGGKGKGKAPPPPPAAAAAAATSPQSANYTGVTYSAALTADGIQRIQVLDTRDDGWESQTEVAFSFGLELVWMPIEI